MILVVSAPSGGGKGTILAEVLKQDPRLVHSVSVTTRKPRQNEVNGVHYSFMSVGEFESRKDAGDFREWAEVHGNYYGTLNEEIDTHTASGEDVVLELDVQGKRSMEAARPEAKTIFIMPPSLEILEQRLRDRGGLSEEELQTRLKNAEDEIAVRDEYDYIIVNDELEHAIARFKEILMELRRD